MRVWTKSIALVTVLGFAVAACGSDDDGDGGAAATDAPSRDRGGAGGLDGRRDRRLHRERRPATLSRRRAANRSS